MAALWARLDADVATRWEQPRAGKCVTLWEQAVSIDGVNRPVRRVLRLIERSIDKHGQVLIVPDLTLEGWTTSLPAAQFNAKAILALYADHATHEQFHSVQDRPRVRCGVGGVRCAQACERIGVAISTGKSLRKPLDDAIDGGIVILAIKLRLEIGRSDYGSRIQDSAIRVSSSSIPRCRRLSFNL